MTQLSYFSRPADGTTLVEINEILGVARVRNREASITGFMLYRHDCFVQVLEGGREQVSRLLERIMADDRHREINLVGCEDVERRTFSNWSMGFLSMREVSRRKLLEYSDTGDLDLARLDHGSLVELMAELAELAESSLPDSE
ncbi:BLUF domain-containing protein [Engelhardtia mirabilis]|uniref:Blue light-and temperature-regulated antirepressor YcgF n=1 Tax=Engelhardtia mirabilis TaxID=2528011 RepID=A0A518BJP1_9BACT|nr:Blue light- and temperature-regulated antirepressor YcgF [Planctomycetes bacterium Pla133]QDV01528.1 Blue light- and temperature-regulated antirepressor YcgF [Planctomycetes bacterium Pla86]